MKRRWPFAADGDVLERTHIGQRQLRIHRVQEPPHIAVCRRRSAAVRTTRLNDGNEICGCGYQNAGRAAGVRGRVLDVADDADDAAVARPTGPLPGPPGFRRESISMRMPGSPR
jgi:hypothetical protein